MIHSAFQLVDHCKFIHPQKRPFQSSKRKARNQEKIVVPSYLLGQTSLDLCAQTRREHLKGNQRQVNKKTQCKQSRKTKEISQSAQQNETDARIEKLPALGILLFTLSPEMLPPIFPLLQSVRFVRYFDWCSETLRFLAQTVREKYFRFQNTFYLLFLLLKHYEKDKLHANPQKNLYLMYLIQFHVLEVHVQTVRP